MMQFSQRRFVSTVVAAVLLASVGCAATSNVSNRPRSKSASLLDRLPWVDSDKDDEGPYPNPVKMASTWTPDTLVQTGRTPTRGFGGRLFFYDEKSRPVPVDGTLIVHGFDEDAPDPKAGVKRFEFTPEQFTKHFSKTELGASYSVWIPWDAMGGERKRISLVASFQTPEGKLVQGTPATLMLPGGVSEDAVEKFAKKLSPEYMKYKNAVASGGSAKASGLTTTTIKRHRFKTTVSDGPAISLPSGNRSMLAKGTQTPSADISGFKRPGAGRILPASAELPVSGGRLPPVQQSTRR